MKFRSLASIAFFCLGAVFLHQPGQLRAETIAGPSSWGVVGGNDTVWGIQFTALQNGVLTGFDFNHRPGAGGDLFSGTVQVIDTAGPTPVFSANYGPNQGGTGVTSYSGLLVYLTAGHVYQLVATSDIHFGTNNELFQYIGSNTPVITYPTSNSVISVTQGVFDANPGFQEANAWGAFSNITSTVPEPSSIVLLGLGATGVALGMARRRRLAA